MLGLNLGLGLVKPKTASSALPVIPVTSGLWANRDLSQESYAHNDPVGSLLDHSVNTRNMAQTTTSKKFTAKDAAFNGLQWAFADGVDDCLTTASSLLDQNELNFTLFFLIAADTDVNGATFYSEGNSGSSTRWMALQQPGVSKQLRMQISNDAVVETQHDTDDWYGADGVFEPMVITIIAASGVWTGYKNGVVDSTGTYTPTVGLTFNQSAMGCMKRSSEINFREYYFREDALFNRTLTTQERTDMEDYLAIKGGI